MSKIIYVLIAILIYMIINLFIVIKKNTKILHFAGSILFLQVFLLSVVNSHFITLSEYSVCEYIYGRCPQTGTANRGGGFGNQNAGIGAARPSVRQKP